MIETAYIKEITLENIRAFKHFHMELGSGGSARMISVIVGRNGTCKTTLLRCLAMGLCDESEASALLAEFGGRLVAEDADKGYIQLQLVDYSQKSLGEIRLLLENKKGRDVLKRKTSIGDVDFFVCGYGPQRGNTGTSMVRDYRPLDSVATLFDYQRSLVDIELTLRRLEDYLGTSRYENAQKGIKRILGLGSEHSIRYAKGGGLSISGPGIGKDIPLAAWADGYRMTFNWLIDLYGWAMHADVVTETGGIRGILLVDEIDQNLHPSLQSRLIGELRQTLPEMQIFASTHSPLTALGTDAQNVISLQRKDNSVYRASVPPLAGYSADDALSEESLFGTDPYPQPTRRKLERHRELAAVPCEERTREQVFELRDLSSELNPAELPAFRDDPVIRKLDHIADLLKKEKPS
jgi:hypothetical protein